MPITLTGTGFHSDYYSSPSFPSGQPGLTVYVSPYATGGGVSVTNIEVVNSTTITCDFEISQTAEIGVRTVRVQVGSEEDNEPSNTLTFTVGYPSDFLVFFG